MTIKNFSVKNGLTAGNITLNATTSAISTSGNITVGNANLGNLATANFFQGDGGLLSNINITAGSSITNGNSNVAVSENSNITVSVSGNANIAVFSDTGINIAGYTTITGNLTAANANLGNLVIANYFSGSGNNLSNIQGANVSGQVSNALVAGTVYTNAQPNITSVGSLTDLTVSGNVFAPAIVQNASTYDTRISLSSAAGVVEITSAGNSTQFLPSGQINLGGASQIAGGTFAGSTLTLGTSQTNLVQSRGGNVTVQVGTDGSITDTWTFANNGNTIFPAAGNANLGNAVTANYFIGDGSLLTGISTGSTNSISNGNSNVTVAANSNVTVSVAGNANVITFTGTGINVAGYTNVTGNLTVGAISNLGPASNVIITGGTANYVLSTDGTGNLSWVAAAPGSSATIETFTGNGVQTTFTLSSAPANINLVTVNYNGAIVFHESFTLSGANLTFGSAPANGSKLEITTLVPSISGGGGASDARAMGYSLVFGG